MQTEDTLAVTLLHTMETLERMAKAFAGLGAKTPLIVRPMAIGATKLDEARLWLSEALALLAVNAAEQAEAVNPVQRD